MKQENRIRRMPAAALALGGVCLALRLGLYAVAVDEKGLLLRGHPLEKILWAVAAAACLLVALVVWRREGSDRYEENFAPSAGAAFGHFLLAGGIALTVLTNVPGVFGTLGFVWKLLGLLSVPLLLWAGVCRLRGKKPLFLIHGVLCVFLLIHIMNQYQRWCGNPQLMDYVFALLGSMMLAFFAYYTAAFEAGCANPRMHLLSGLLAVLLCTGALSGAEFPLLYLGGTAWALTDLCRQQPPPEGEGSAYDAA